MHLVCDDESRPAHLHLTATNKADITQVDQCLEPHVIKGTTVIAERCYDANHLREWLNEIYETPCIAPRKNRKVQVEYDTEFDKTRNIIDRMFNRINDWQQFSLCTARYPETFLAAAHIVAIIIWFLCVYALKHLLSSIMDNNKSLLTQHRSGLWWTRRPIDTT